ncbi:GntR family transcriptional regulator [Thioclava sp. GXIMD4216]|uniref:GntR family transcriptional regulator n=1 Tax=Thioclava litoralis TaxID=3076557 RepID=A0ABZ1E3X0_9RHOB|nr:GntR family transcriptional regulator [Thioclava sp. FTW29]
MSKETCIPDLPPYAGDTVQDHCYRRLRHAVMLGLIAPGTQLTLRGLAEQMKLSPTPIREAVRRLSSERGIEVLGNRRLQIPQMTAGRFEELIALRVMLETHAALRALPHITDRQIDQMEALDREMDLAIQRQDLDELTRLNQVFHRMLYCANPDHAAQPMIESLWLQLGPFQRHVLGGITDHYKIDRHKEMLAALRARASEALSTALRADITDGSIRVGRRALGLPETGPTS